MRRVSDSNSGIERFRRCLQRPRSRSAARCLKRNGKSDDAAGFAELRAMATRALANGDDYSRALLREQLEAEEFAEEPKD